MADSVWRRLLLAICALAVFCAILAGISLAIQSFGDLGMRTAPSRTPYAVRVVSVEASGPAERAGIKPGDLIDTRAESFELRSSYVRPGTAYAVPVIQANGVHSVRVVARTTHTDPLWWLYIATDVWLVAFAALIAIRQSESRDAHWLALILVTLAFADLPIWIETTNSAADTLLNVLSELILVGASVLLTFCFSRLASPVSTSRRILTNFVYFVAIVQGVAIAATHAAKDFAWLDVSKPAFSGAWIPAFWTVLEIGSLLCGVLAALGTHGLERRRIAWTVASFAPAFGGYALWHIVMLIAPSSPVDTFFRTFESFLWMLAPVALTYSLLTRRFIDIGFVLNRAAVFALVTGLVVGAFVIVEWSLAKWFESATGITDLAVNAIVVLVLGYSLRFVHQYVDYFVDRVFFKKRHECETALRRFAREAEFISDKETLLHRALDTIRANTEAQSVDILLQRDGVYVPGIGTSAHPQVIGENDPAILCMRAWHEPVALHTVDSAIHGELAFPMGVRGAVAGVLVCGAKSTGESYAPDEADALALVAQGVGSALGSFDTRNSDPIAKLQTSIDAATALMREAIDALKRTST